MKQAISIITLTLLVASSCNNSNTASKSKSLRPAQNEIQKPKIDTELTQDILIKGGQVRPCSTIFLNGSKFHLAIRVADTIYLGTHDKNFVTPEGYSVGMEFSTLPDSLKTVLIEEPGWGYYVILPSKWALGFCIGSSCIDHRPAASSEIGWIFKRPRLF